MLSLFKKPTNQADWSPDQKTLVEVSWLDDNTVTLRHLRHCHYRTFSDYDVSYYEQTIKLSTVKRVWFLHEPFAPLAAHTLLSFEFLDGTYLAASVEIRKRRGQRFSQLLVFTFLRRHELMYVWGDEKDLILLRSRHRNNPTYLYPLTLSQSEAAELLRDMINRTATLARTPEFYHPLWNTCFTNLIAHFKRATKLKLPFSLRVIFTTRAHQYLYQHRLINQRLPLTELKAQSLINNLVKQASSDTEFSRHIRGGR